MIKWCIKKGVSSICPSVFRVGCIGLPEITPSHIPTLRIFEKVAALKFWEHKWRRKRVDQLPLSPMPRMVAEKGV